MDNTSSQSFFPMHNVIQHYPWGSKTAMTEWFDIPNPDHQHQAEIWMGAHPNGCSHIQADNKTIGLNTFIQSNGTAILGEATHRAFGELPYLFKVLAAEDSLSIQVHPSKAQAEAGFALEEQAGIARTAPTRNYKDANHKPELVYALTPYQAMNGFRDYKDIVHQFQTMNLTSIAPLVTKFAASPNAEGLKGFFAGLLSLQGEAKATALAELMAYAHEHRSQDALCALILTLENQHPGDIGLFCPLILNVLTLQPGEAMYLDACTPHAYIHGTALEIMANSDNVIRSGLTPKHMDIPELLKCTRFDSKPAHTLRTAPLPQDGYQLFPVPVKDFKFAIIESGHSQTLTTESAEILFPIDDAMTLTHPNGDTLTVSKGESVFIPAYAQTYTVSSHGRVARAFN